MTGYQYVMPGMQADTASVSASSTRPPANSSDSSPSTQPETTHLRRDCQKPRSVEAESAPLADAPRAANAVAYVGGALELRGLLALAFTWSLELSDIVTCGCRKP